MKVRFSLPLLFLCACRSSPAHEVVSTRPSRSFGLVYHAAVEKLPADAQRVRLWIPFPEDTSDQTIDDLRATVLVGNASFEIPSESLESNSHGSFGGAEWTVSDIQDELGRSLHIETKGKPIEVDLSFDVTRFETQGGGDMTAGSIETALEADSMIPLDGKVAAQAASLVTSEDPATAVRQLYEHTLERMRYDKPPGEAWGRGDAEWACDSRFGNCTDFHSYFMGLARSKSIPARFVIGFSVPQGEESELAIAGYHCWAYAWIEGRGWTPLDISEADKHPEKTDFFFGTLDCDRVAFTSGRDLVPEPAPEQGPLNFWVYPYAEVDGKTWSSVAKSFKRVKVD